MFTNSMNFDLGEDVNAVREMVHGFAQERIKPLAEQADKTNEFPNELWTEFGELGLLGVTTAEEYGGSDMSYLAHVVIVEEIARASASISLSYGAHSNLCVNQIRRNAPKSRTKVSAKALFRRTCGCVGDVRGGRRLRRCGHEITR